MSYLTPDAPPANRWVYRILRVPAQNDWIALVSGALASLVFESSWEEFGDYSAEDTAQLMKRIFLDYQDLYMPRVGQLVYSVVADPSPDWLPCNGTIYEQADYPELMEVINPFFKHNATQFFTPHMGGRALVGVGDMYPTGENYAPYEFGGSEYVTLSSGQMPVHTHGLFVSLGTTPVVAPGEVPVVLPNALPGETGAAGLGQSHENRHPFLAVPIYMVAR